MKRNTRQSGFTLLEMFVSIAVFIVVMLIATGSLLSIIDASRKAQAQKEVFNNLNFALEGITRTVRVGTTYHCVGAGTNPIDVSQDCPTTGSSEFAFEHNDGDTGSATDQYVYRLMNGTIELSKDSQTESSFQSITSSNVVVEYLRFYVAGAEADDAQAHVLITVGGFVQDSIRTRTEFNIETLVSQRAFAG